jgi:hypothetical protein
MDAKVLIEIESLRRVSMADLRTKYQEVFQEETRCRHREHLFRRIAWRLQALSEGDLSERARARAHEIAQDADLRTIAPRSIVHAKFCHVSHNGSAVPGVPLAIFGIDDHTIPVILLIADKPLYMRTCEDLRVEDQPTDVLQAPTTRCDFWMRADSPRVFTLFLQGGELNFPSYGLSPQIAIDTTWKQYSASFVAPVTATDGRLEFWVGDMTGTVWIDDVQVSALLP